MNDEKACIGSVLLEEFAAVHGGAFRACEAVDDQARQDHYNALVHSLAVPGGQSALCLSGGGSRSAAFALGNHAGLARRGLLSKFDYLSTVSGGGYIAGWLTAAPDDDRDCSPGGVRSLPVRLPGQAAAMSVQALSGIHVPCQA